ncbi:MAG: ADP-glyceromanno-heptose 6-epimerase [Chitinispirillaceae bacterium]|nr:ADP-glyceromanno-heptose 6-epimerase [Chitinispirillaceae bacterium]
MIVVTGGAGFIGSALVWALNKRGIEEIIIVDHLNNSEKWKNLISLRYRDYLDREQFINELEEGYFGNDIEVLFHLGACSTTTEKDAGYLMENNFGYSKRIGLWWENHSNTRLIYASSAATYGSGENGYKDDLDTLKKLRPLNMYGYSKQLFDLYAYQKGWLKSIVGLKFFNVFGPNEYHKGEMRSLINKAFPRAKNEGKIFLFKSCDPSYADGEQKRDFIYIKDAIAMTLYFMEHKEIGGIFNIGSGKARSWNDIAFALGKALKKTLEINYIEMPEELKGKYQNFTEADLYNLRKVGCLHNCISLEEAINEYVNDYLLPNKYLDPSV